MFAKRNVFPSLLYLVTIHLAVLTAVYAEKLQADALAVDGPAGMTFRLIPSGVFLMGSSSGFSAPIRRVKVSKSFYISTTEVTRAQYAELTGKELSESSEGSLPQNFVQYADAEKFAQSVTLKKTTCRLPTEAEWERACAYDHESSNQFDGSVYGQKLGPEPVASRKANTYGLHDMVGNVWEWVMDDAVKYEKNPESDVIVDPVSRTDKEKGTYWGVLRGGAYHSSEDRVSCQVRQKVDRRYTATSFVGIRVVCVEGS